MTDMWQSCDISILSGDLPIGPVPPVGTTIEVDMVTAQSPSDFYVLSASVSY